MHNGTNGPVQIDLSGNNIVVTFPGCEPGSSNGTVIIPAPLSGGSLPFDLNFNDNVVVEFPGASVGTVTFPSGPGRPPVELPIPGEGIGLIEMPHGGRISIAHPTRRERIKVTLKSGDQARLFTQAAAM